MIGHVSPEAADGGAIGLVRDGDPIRIDVHNRKLDALVDLSSREPAVRENSPRYTSGVLARFASNVASASLGATTCPMDPPRRADEPVRLTAASPS